VLSAVVTVMLGALLLRETLSLTVLPERAPPFVRLSDGGIRNAYLLKLADKSREGGRYALVLEGAPGLRLLVQDAATDAAARPLLPVPGGGVAGFRALVTAPPVPPAAERMPIRFRLLDAAGRPVAEAESVFLGPQQ
jgi:polyferredoxin